MIVSLWNSQTTKKNSHESQILQKNYAGKNTDGSKSSKHHQILKKLKSAT